ncbi:MAG: pantetheine-phosphate adenylyltransferase [Polyangiales bacterium]
MRGIAVYPGSFDPITKGHTAILESGLVAFEKIIVAVLNNDNKKALFSVAERMEMIRESAIDMGADPKRIEVDSFDGLLVSYAQRRNARVILRGLRAVADFEYELQMANMNRHLAPEVETVFIMANDAYFYVASNLVKEVTRLGGNVADLVPAPVLPRLLAKFDK